MSAPTPFKKPLSLHVRERDGSCYVQMGEPESPPFMAFDLACDEDHAAYMVEATNQHAALLSQVARLREGLGVAESALQTAVIRDRRAYPTDTEFHDWIENQLRGLRALLAETEGGES